MDDEPAVVALGRPFWLAWAAGTVSTLGDGIRYVAFPLLAAGVTRDPGAIALVAAAGHLPWVLFGLIGGAVVDRVDRRRLMAWVDLARAGLVAGFTALVVAEQASITLIATTSFLLGIGQTLFDNADSAILPMLVARAQLERANAWLVTSQTVMATLVGAPIGAALFALSPGLPPAVDAVTFAGSALLILAIRGRYRIGGDRPDTSVGQEIWHGLHWLWSNQLLRTLCLLLTLMSLTFAAAEAVLVLYALDVLGTGAFGYSALLVAFAVGGLAGSAVTPAMTRRLSLRVVITGTSLGQAGGILLVGLTATTGVALGAVALVGACNLAWTVTTISIRQRLTPGRLLGRVTSSYRVLAFSSSPLGAVLGGVVARRYGLPVTYLAGAILLAAGTLACLPFLRDDQRPYPHDDDQPPVRDRADGD